MLELASASVPGSEAGICSERSMREDGIGDGGETGCPEGAAASDVSAWAFCGVAIDASRKQSGKC